MIDTLKTSDPGLASTLQKLAGPDGKTVYDAMVAVDKDADEGLQNTKTLAGVLIARSNTLCDTYLANIAVGQRAWRTALTVSATTLGAAGGISTPARSAALLSSLAGVASGVRGNLDENLLGNQAGYLVRTAARTQREQMQKELITTMTSGELKDQSIGLVWPYIEHYHGTCTVSDALSALNKAASQPNTGK